MKRKEIYQRVLSHFRQQMPEPASELKYADAFQLLVAVMLSAQCTDKRVNMVTPELFRQFPDPRSLAMAKEEDVRRLISSVSYPNAKANHLVEMAKGLVEDFGGQVPGTRDELTSLKGVGRKTANVVLAIAFGMPTMAVDTHVFRVSHRLGLVGADANTPEKVEHVLTQNIPDADIPTAHHWLLLHGRYVCLARKPLCPSCPFVQFCPWTQNRSVRDHDD